MNWIKIIIYVLQLILEGMSKGEAVVTTAMKFGVSKSDISKRL
jgi:uncharacterized protein YoaH (UPF0181 family)